MPEAVTLHVDQYLTTVSQEYRNPDYIADTISPPVQVSKMSDKILKFAKSDNLAIPDDALSPTSEANEVDWGSSYDSYVVAGHAYKRFIPQEEIDNADNPIKPALKVVRTLTEKMLLGREKRVADLLRATSVLTQNTTLSGTSQWNDYTNSVPLSDIQTGIDACFFKPNTFIVPRQVMSKLKYHTKLLALTQYTSRTSVTAEILAGLIADDLGTNVKVVSPEAQYRTSAPGITPETYGFVWGKDAILARVGNPELEDLSVGFSFRFQDFLVRRWRDETRGLKGGEVVQVVMAEAIKVLGVDVAYLIKTAVA